MNTKTALIAASFALVLAAPVALAQMQGGDMSKMMQMMTPKPDDPASTQDLKKSHMDMMQNMNTSFTGNPDADFARSMIKHHEGGIAMAKVQLKHGKDPELRAMAEKLIREQGDENKKFEAWLKKHPQ